MSDASDPLPIHPGIRVVTLDNGLRAWIWRHPRPAGTVCLALHLATGSLNESDDERGLSHFIEHLAFHGSAHFPPGAVQSFFAAMGTRLGRHHNAFTAPDRTCYSLTLADNLATTVETAVLCLADIGGGLSLLGSAVEVERRVILEEMRARAGVVSRVREALLGRLLTGSRLVVRHPLGTEEVVRRVGPEELRAFYRRWYRPELATVMAVGDLDPDAVEALVRKHFAGWRGAGPTPEALGAGIREPAEDRTSVVADPEVSETHARVLRARPWRPPSTRAELARELVDEAAAWLVSRRLAERSQSPGAPFGDAGMALAPLVRGWQLVRMAAAGDGDGGELVAAVLTELRRLLVHGFTSGEVEVGAARLGSVLTQAARGEANAGADTLAGRLRRAAAAGRPPMSREQVRELAVPVLERLDRHTVHRALADAVDAPGVLVAAVVPGDLPEVPSEAQLAESVRAVRRLRPAPPQDVVVPFRLLDAVPEPAPVVDQRVEEAVDTLSATLANGVRVHAREMDFRRHRVFLQVNLAGGRILESADEVGLTAAVGSALARPAVAGFSSIQVRDALARHGVALESAVDEDVVELRLSGDPEELEAGLELIHLLLSRPRVEPTTLDAWRRTMEERWASRRVSLEVRLAEEALRLLTGDDPRFRLLDPPTLRLLDAERVQGWLEGTVLPAPVEAAIVGDLEREQALDLLARYLGTLPPRPRTDPRIEVRRGLEVEPGPLASELVLETDPGRAALLMGWRAAPWSETHQRLLLQMAEQVLQQRLSEELREARGLTYSAECSYRPSKGIPGASLLSVACYLEPSRLDEAAQLTRSVVGELVADGPDEEEMASVRRQFADIVARVQRDPRYWCRVLSEVDLRGVDVATLAALPGTVAGLTAGEMRASMARWLTEAGMITVVCRPRGRS